jgi:hypothetical protein
MIARRRCSFSRRWFYPHPRLKQRQKTCGQSDCRRKQKQKSSRQWRTKYPDYFRGSYEHQKEIYGTRSDYKRRYRQQHPDYVRRNAAFVQKCRQRLRSAPVSPTSPDLQVTLESERASLRIAHVSHTSRDIFVTLVQVPLSRPFAELHCATRLRIWRASSSCCNAGVGGARSFIKLGKSIAAGPQ